MNNSIYRGMHKVEWQFIERVARKFFMKVVGNDPDPTQNIDVSGSYIEFDAMIKGQQAGYMAFLFFPIIGRPYLMLCIGTLINPYMYWYCSKEDQENF